jgi:hypothetical protein
MMKSPFPGMDPYLEQHWGDVHNTLITYAKEVLNERLPRDLRARTQERIVVEMPGEDHTYYPDVRVVEDRRSGGGSTTAVAGTDVAMADPLVVHFHEPETQTFLEIIEAGPERRVITVLEIVSPSNKVGRGREQYLQKQQDLSEGGVNLVEIDLLRGGPHVLQLPLSRYPASHRTPYKVCVCRAGKAAAEIYRVPLRDPLPTIRVPLRPDDADVPLELQTLIAQVYHHGRYDDIDYTLPPVPPLDPDDDTWADELLRAAGKRPAKTV